MRLLRPHVARVLVQQKDRVLLVHSKDFYPSPSPWEFPGGGVKKKEAGIKAAARELWEETGVSATPHDLEFVCQFAFGAYVPKMRVNFYKALRWKEPAKLAWDPEEITEAAWIPLSELTGLYLSRRTVSIMRELKLLP